MQLIFIALILFALWWVLTPRGLPIPIGAYRDRDNGFAFKVPDTWQQLTPETIRAITDRLGGALPGNLRSAMQSRSAAVSFVRESGNLAYVPSMNVVVVKGRPPAINEKSKFEAGRAIRQGIGTFLEAFTEETLDLTTVDRLKSLRIIYSGTMNLNLGGELGSQSYAIRFQQLFVPGRGQGYILTFSATQTQYEEMESEFRQIINSFRVLKHPARFDSVLQGAVVGGLVGMLVFFVGAILRRFSGR